MRWTEQPRRAAAGLLALALLLTALGAGGVDAVPVPGSAEPASAPFQVPPDRPWAAAFAPQPPASGASQPADLPPPPAISDADRAAWAAALRAQRAGKMDDARRGFEALAAANPRLAGPHANLGLIHRQAGRLDASVAALGQSLRLSPRQPAVLTELGISYRQQGRFERAAEAYEAALALAPQHAPALLNLGVLCDVYLGQPARALGLFNQYLAVTPGGDATVAKWVAELKTRKPVPGAPGAASAPPAAVSAASAASSPSAPASAASTPARSS